MHDHLGKDNKWRKLDVSKWKWATTKAKGSSQGEQPRKCRMTKIHFYKCEKVLRRWVPNIHRWKSLWELEFLNVLNFCDKIVNNKCDPNWAQYAIRKLLTCRYQIWAYLLHLELIVKSYDNFFWPKVKLTIWLLINKNPKIEIKWPLIEVCDIMLKRSSQKLQDNVIICLKTSNLKESWGFIH